MNFTCWLNPPPLTELVLKWGGCSRQSAPEGRETVQTQNYSENWDVLLDQPVFLFKIPQFAAYDAQMIELHFVLLLKEENIKYIKV